MATITQTKLVGFGYGNKSNYNATTYANHIWFDPTNKQILLNGIEYIPKKLSELVNDSGFLTSANFKIENTATTAVKKITMGGVSGNFYSFDQGVNGNYVLAGATSSSSNTGATFRKLVEADIPALSIGKITNLQSTLDTKLSSITKAMVENVLTGTISSHTHTFASITSKPTTLSGYGITDAALASDLSKYLPLTGGTLTGDLTCNGSFITMSGSSGAKGYKGYFNQSATADRASGSHVFMGGGGYALGTNAVSIGYQAYAGIRNKDSDSDTYPYIHWQWFPTERFTVNTTSSSLGGGEFYGYPLLPDETVEWEIGGQKNSYQNSSNYKEVLVVIKDSDDGTLVFGGKTSLPYRASKTLIAGKYIVGSGEYLKKIDEYTINGVKYYQVIIYTWTASAFPASYDFTQQVKVMCATKVNNSNYNGASSYASGYYSVASGNSSVASGYYSVASGYSSVASGYSSVASGYSSVASGNFSVASGYSSVASGNFSVAMNYKTIASSAYQLVIGRRNATDSAPFVIGNGSGDNTSDANATRSNCFVVDWSGNVTAKYFSGYANAVGGEGFKIYPENTNQINFGGTGSDSTVVFGAASKDSRSVPTTYKFGADGKATLMGSADMLDGYHESSFMRGKGASDNLDLSTLTTNGVWSVNPSGFPTNDGGLGDKVSYKFGTLLCLSSITGSSSTIQIYQPHVSEGWWIRNSYKSTNQFTTWKQFAFLDSNVSSATKLQTARTLWGKSFDGTNDVSGKITVSGDIQYMIDDTTRFGSSGMRLFSDEGFIGFSHIIGMADTDGTSNGFTGISLGWGTNPEDDDKSVRINKDTFTYKGNPILHSGNFNGYAPTLTGGGASGTWGIDISGNAATASRLGSDSVGMLNTPIYIKSGAATAVSAIKESLLTYGIDSNFSGTVSPIDMAVSAIHSANRIAFGNPKGVTVEYSQDGGTSWLDYGATDAQKTMLISGLGQTFYVGGSDASVTVSTLFMLRITLNAVNLGTYTRPRKALINISTGGATNCQVKIESATVGSPTTFTTDAIYPISGWSGWNSIPLGYKGTFGGGGSQTSNNGVFRFTFSIGTLSSSSSNSSRLSVSDIAIYGDTYWTTPSTLAKTGHLYTYDDSKNVTFPAKVTAASFARSGSSDSYVLLGGGGHKVVSDFATTSVATASANGLMSTAMFNAKFVDNVTVKQGVTKVAIDGTEEIVSRSIYIRPNKTNVGGGYVAIDGSLDVAIPNATTTYDGSMSYTDKARLDGIFSKSKLEMSFGDYDDATLGLDFDLYIGDYSPTSDTLQFPMATTSLCGLMTGTDKVKLDKMPSTVFGCNITVANAGACVINTTFGDYNVNGVDASIGGVDTTQSSNHYITIVNLDIVNSTLKSILQSGFIKFSYSSKDKATYQVMRLLQSNFDDADLFIEYIHTEALYNVTFDCIWEIYH